jgi:hypothetical protein
MTSLFVAVANRSAAFFALFTWLVLAMILLVPPLFECLLIERV